MTPRSSPELLALAARIIWFEPAETALQQPIRFLAYLMTYGTAEDIAAARAFFTPEDFREAVENAPPGIMDARSWAYWNVVVGRDPPPPMPRRSIPGAPAPSDLSLGAFQAVRD